MALTASLMTCRTPASMSSGKYSLGTPMRRPARSPPKAGSEVRHLQGRRRGVARVVASHEVHRQGAVAHVPGQGPDLVQGAGEGHQPEAADPAVGGLQSRHAAEAGRLADAAAGVRAQGEEALAGGHRGRRAARGAARHAPQVPGVVSGKEARVLGRGAHGELVHVGLADHDGTRL